MLPNYLNEPKKVSPAKSTGGTPFDFSLFFSISIWFNLWYSCILSMNWSGQVSDGFVKWSAHSGDVGGIGHPGFKYTWTKCRGFEIHPTHMIRSLGFGVGAVRRGKYVSEKPYLVRLIHTLSYALAMRWPISGKHIHLSSGASPIKGGTRAWYISSTFSLLPSTRVYKSLLPLNSLIRVPRTIW